MITRRRFLTISALSATALLSGVTDRRVEWRGLALGADVSIVLYGPSQKEAEHALMAARETLSRMEALFSIYNPDSEISRLNRDQTRQLPADFMDLVHIVDQAHSLTGGLFDPTVQPAFIAHSKGLDIDPALDDRLGWKHVKIGPSHLRFQRPGMALTFNGIAQGFATDRVRDRLLDHGFDGALVNIGEFRVGSQPMTIGIARADGSIRAVETLTHAALATSSANGFRFADGSSHILHPLKRRPPVWASATVIAPEAAIADALSTALVLAEGPQLGQQLVAQAKASRILLEDLSGHAFWI